MEDVAFTPVKRQKRRLRASASTSRGGWRPTASAKRKRKREAGRRRSRLAEEASDAEEEAGEEGGGEHEQSFESRQHAQFERAAKREAPAATTATRRAALSEVGTDRLPTPPPPHSLDQQQVEQSPRRLAWLARRSPSRRRIARAPQVGLRGGAGRHRGQHRPRSRFARHPRRRRAHHTYLLYSWRLV